MAASDKTPVFVIVPGAFNHPSGYQLIADKLKAVSQTVEIISPSSTSAFNDSAGKSLSMYQDAAEIREVLEKHIGNGRDIHLVMHSYGGVSGAEACKGLAKSTLQDNGSSSEAGVKTLVYLAGCVGSEGMSTVDLFPVKEGLPPPSFKDGWGFYEDWSVLADHFYPEVSPEEARTFLKAATPQFFQVLLDKQTYEAWRDIPVVYIHTKQDKMITFTVQKECVERIRAGNKTNQVHQVEMDTGHSPHQTSPDKLLEILLQYCT